MNVRAPVKKARGLGSAKDGTHHFWTQRLTGLALVPLLIWFVASLVALVGAPYIEVVAWIARPFNALVLLLAIVALSWHSMLGLQVVVEDYVHTGWLKLTILITLTFAHVALGAAAAFAVLRIGFAS
ncbi:MAG: succinate dehydrogenase, hydrophobic membrane anchor protein [Gammaproteobacteria bacterium]